MQTSDAALASYKDLAPEPAMAPVVYKKHFLPLESDPDVFNELSHELGLSKSLCFQEVISLDDLSFLHRPALALILTYQTTKNYENQRSERNKDHAKRAEGPDEHSITWFKQTINNACGLYALLHVVANPPHSVGKNPV